MSVGEPIKGKNVIIGKNFNPGKYCIIGDNVILGDNVTIGDFCKIDSDVVTGDNVRLGDYVKLKSGTRMGNNIDMADYCCTTGICYIGNDVNVRTRSTVSKGVILEDKVFIGAGVMMSHTKNVYHHRPTMPKQQLIARVNYGCIVGSHSNMMAGVEIGPDVIVGYNSNVVKSITEAGVYMGNPATRRFEVPKVWLIKEPDDYERHQFSKEMLEKYLPFYTESQ